MVEKFRRKYLNMSAPAKAAFWYAICSVVQRGIQFIVVPIYTRVLTTTEYGNYSVFMSWTELFQIICTLNLFYNCYNVGLTKFDNDRDSLSSSLLGLCITVTCIMSVVYFLFASQWNVLLKMNTVLCGCMFYHLIVKAPYFFWMTRQRYDYRYRVVIAGTLMIAIGIPSLALISMPFFEDKSMAVIYSKIFLETLLGVPALFMIIKKGKKIYSKFYWSYGLRNNIPLVPYYMSQIILNHSDRLMINYICGTGEAGIYTVAYSAAMLLTIINNAINNSLIPWEFKKLRKSDTQGIHQVTFSLMLFVMAMNAMLIALAPEAMTIMAAKAYHDAIWIVPPVSCSAYLLFMSQQFINIELYYEENKYIAYSSIGVAALNLVLNWIFIHRFGYIAAGYTTLFCYLIFALIHYFTMRSFCKRHLDNVKIWEADKLLLVTIAFIVFSGCMLMCYRGRVIRYSVVLIILVIGYIKRKTIRGFLNLKKKKS